MAEEEQVVAEARAVGWRPPAELEAEGKTGTFLSAEEYLARGKAIMPFLRKDNEKLTRQVLGQERALTDMQARLREANESIKGLEEYHAEMLGQNAKRIREETKRELAAAAKEGDFDEVARLTEVLAQPLEVPVKKKAEEIPPAPVNAADDVPFQAWAAQNRWFFTDKARAAMATGVGADIKGREPNLIGPAFYARLDAELALIAPPARPKSKIDGDGGTPPSPRGDGKSYGDLPADAKEACGKFEKRFSAQIGEGKRYPNVNAWRAKYAADFFKE